MVFCPVVAVVMLESRVARCVHCADGVACQANSDLLVISCSSTCFGRLYAHHREVGLRFTAYGFCPVVAVVMLESRVARCVHCAEGVACQANSDLLVISYSSTYFGLLYAHHLEVGLRFTAYGFCPVVAVACNILLTMHTPCHPTLQHHNSYNRTQTIGSETQSDLLMLGVKKPETC